ncbi:MAG TPA: hypothetical protein VL693_07455 [Vicinamibacterales bacterium]|nr:hypothetical protein [Vicinamibacterales bacterium]
MTTTVSPTREPSVLTRLNQLLREQGFDSARRIAWRPADSFALPMRDDPQSVEIARVESVA